MHLRRLELKDAPHMLEWMHDKNVTEYLHADFASKTLSDTMVFIRNSWKDQQSVHYAIASDNDEYMGTVSLKHIDDGNAEFAITISSKAMGYGYSWFGMKNILKIAFQELKLEEVYWCVSKDNIRAIRFYDKHHFQEAITIVQAALERYANIPNLKWYNVHRSEIID